jgi:hypothetical protein
MVMDISIVSGEPETSLHVLIYMHLLPLSSGLRSETLVPINETTQCYILENCNVHSHCCVNPTYHLGPCPIVGFGT